MDNLHKILMVVIIIILLIAGFGAFAWLRAHDAWKDMQADIRVRDEAIKNNKATENKANVVVSNAEASNKQIDSETKQKLDQIQKQLASKPDSGQTLAMIQAAIPNIQIATTQAADGTALISVPDTQENRDAINKVDADYKSCKFNLDDCQRKQVNFLAEIDAKQIIINAKQATIDEQKATITEMSRFGKGGNVWSRTLRVATPIGCAVGGAWLAGEKNRKAAAIGAATAGTVCAFAFHF